MAETAPPFDPRPLIAHLGAQGHGGALGITYVDHGEDWCALALPYQQQLIGDPRSGVIASGPVIALMDMAAGIALWCKHGFVQQATLDLRVDYLRPATPGRTVIGRGHSLRITRRIGFAAGIAHDGDAEDPIAHVAGTYMFTDAD